MRKQQEKYLEKMYKNSKDKDDDDNNHKSGGGTSGDKTTKKEVDLSIFR